MNPRSVTMFALVVIAAHVTVSKAEAQVFGGPRVFVGAGGPVTLTPGSGYGASYGSVPGSYAPAAPLPYSYYGVPSWQPARIYEGPAVFPFYGRPYGHPYDHWTWPYISGGADANLARYYYPPLG